MTTLYVRNIGRTFVNEVPEDLKFSRAILCTREFKEFCVRLSPNLACAARIRGIPEQDQDEVINNFIAHMLDVSKKCGKQRFLTYDPIKFAGMFYYTWFLHLFGYFITNYHTDFKEISSRQVALVVQVEPGKKHAVTLQHIPDVKSGEFTEEVEIKDLFERIRVYSSQAQKPGFAAMAYDLLVSRVNGEPNKDFCARNGIPQSRASNWAKHLHNLIKKYFGGEIPVFIINK